MSEQEEPGRRLDAYIRVSQVAGRSGENFISPDVQEERIRAWAGIHGHEILEAFRELDVSGAKMDRPLLNEIMRRIDAGETEGVVVYRLDRFGRTLVGALQLIQHIRDEGALFASVSDNFDITTPTGELVLNVLLSLAQFELSRIRENWSEARRRAVERGIHVSAFTPVGYRRAASDFNLRTGRRDPSALEPDPVEAPLVAEMFRRRARGDTWASIREWANASGIPPRQSKGWGSSLLMRIISNRVYLGIAYGSVGGEVEKPDAHAPLIDQATWHAAQQRRGPRQTGPKEELTLLRGFLRCAGCRYTMSARVIHRNGARTPGVIIQCFRAGRNGDCPAPASITAIRETGADDGLESLIVEMMFSRLERIEFEAVDESDDITRLEQRLQDARHEFERDSTDGELPQVLGREMWLKRCAALRVTTDNAEAELEAALTAAGRRQRPVAELREEWQTMSDDEKRDHLASILQMVFVRSVSPVGRPGDELRRGQLLDRIHPVWFDEPAPEVPRQGFRGYEAHPFVFPTDAHPGDAGVATA